MDGELTNDSEELIKILGDRIEEIEHTLNDDEDFCNKDIDATYQTALKFLNTFEIKFNEKLNELKIKLDQIREENINTSKQNQKQFDDEIEVINQLFSSGKHQEALEKFHDYEKQFQQRTTLIQTIPKLYMNDININRYFSIDKPIIIPTISSNINKQNSLDNIKQIKTDFFKKENDNTNEQESIKPCFDIRFKRSDNQQIVRNNSPVNKEIKSPASTTSSRSLRFSTRLPPSSSSRSLTATERDIVTPTLLSSNNQNSRENITSHMQVRSTPSSPNIIPSLMQRQISTINTSKGEGLISTYVSSQKISSCKITILSLNLVTSYQYERNTSLLMTCNENYIIIFQSQSDRLTRWSSIMIERSNPKERDLKWHNLLIKSIGFIDINRIYLFTDREFIIYSSNLSSKLHSCILLTDNNHNTEYKDIQRGFNGIVHDKYIYHIYLNIECHWILSILEVETINHICDHDLTDIFPDIKRFIHICITDRTINFLVKMESSQYAVMFCSINTKIELKKRILLSYAENPLTICPVYIYYIKKYIFFINDPSTKIIHLLSNEKYLQSYSIIAYTLCYVEENKELILTSNNGIYSININEQQNFFSKFH